MAQRKKTIEERKATGARSKPDAPAERVIDATKPEKPAGLPKDVAKVWDRVVARLVAHGLVNDLDQETLILYCFEVAKVEQLTAYLTENTDWIVHSNGSKTKREEVKMRYEAIKAMMRLGASLGNSPAARKSMGIRVATVKNGGIQAKAHILKRRT